MHHVGSFSAVTGLSSCDMHREHGLSCSGVWVILVPLTRDRTSIPYILQGWFLTIRPFGKSHGLFCFFFFYCQGNSFLFSHHYCCCVEKRQMFVVFLCSDTLLSSLINSHIFFAGWLFPNSIIIFFVNNSFAHSFGCKFAIDFRLNIWDHLFLIGLVHTVYGTFSLVEGVLIWSRVSI